MLGDRLGDPLTIRAAMASSSSQIAGTSELRARPRSSSACSRSEVTRSTAFLWSATLQESEGDFSTLPCGDPMLNPTRPKEIPHHVQGPGSDYPHSASAVYERVQNSETL